MPEKIHKCCTCGFQWEHGKNGSHSCTTSLLAKIEKMKMVLTDLLRQIEAVDGTSQLNIDEANLLLQDD